VYSFPYSLEEAKVDAHSSQKLKQTKKEQPSTNAIDDIASQTIPLVLIRSKSPFILFPKLKKQTKEENDY
jgi:hypothetical protein